MENNRCFGCMQEKKEHPICEFCGYDERTQNEPHQLPAGTILRGQYLVGKVLGQGGFGITYLGWDLYLDIPVAIKEYYPGGLVGRDVSVSTSVTSYTAGAREYESNKARFMREGKTLAKFEALQNIVRIHGFFPENNTVYLVMEYAKGQTLQQYLRRNGPMSLDKVMELLTPVMEDLQKVHEAGVIHRDISPDNIMLLDEGGAKLLDFGAVRQVENPDQNMELSKSTEAILKQGFAPAEQYTARGSLGPWTDVYALCATICYCLNGRVPMAAPDRAIDDEPEGFIDVLPLPEQQKAVFRRGMALRPRDRIPSMAELLTQLRKATGTPSPASKPAPAPISRPASVSRSRPAPKPKPAPRPKPKKKFGLWAALAGAAAVFLLVLMLIPGKSAGKPPVSSAGKPEAAEEAAPMTQAPARVVEVPKGDPVTLRMWFHGSNVTPEASDRVMEKLNKLLLEKLNVQLEPIWGTWGDFDTTVSTALASGKNVDIYFTCNWSGDEYNKYAKDGYWVKLDDMLPEYAPELLAAIPQEVWDCSVTDGAEGMGIYAVPGLKDTATQNCWDVNGTLLAELGYDVDAVCAAGLDYYSPEFGEMLQRAKDARGADFYPLLIDPVILERMVNHSAAVAGDLYGANVLSYYYDAEHPGTDLGSTIVNKYATPEFKAFAEKTYEYAMRGFISPRCQQTAALADYRTAAQSRGEYLFGTQSYVFGCEADFSKDRGIDVRMVPETAAYMDCTSGQGAMMAISKASANPERALMFLNLLNTDPEVMTMLNYGLEGFTYNRNEDGTISFINEGRSTYSPWRNGMGNIRLLPAEQSEGADYWEEFSAFYDQAEMLPYGGFIFTPGGGDEVYALGNVVMKYGFNLMSGAVDPSTELPRFLEELEQVGSRAYVAEAQAQLKAHMQKMEEYKK